MGVKKEIKTEKESENFRQGEGTAGKDPRKDQRIHTMYDKEALKVDASDSESESDSSEISPSEDYEESIREFPEIMKVVEEERKEKERKHIEKQLRKRVPPGPISYSMVWNRGWRSSFKRMKTENSNSRTETGEVYLGRSRCAEEKELEFDE